ncbi:MAG: hypothetical protein AB1540_16090 [Bdellovibrionota bacterium]
MTKRNLIKDALVNLKVSQPLKLKNKAVELKAPVQKQNEQTSVQNNTTLRSQEGTVDPSFDRNDPHVRSGFEKSTVEETVSTVDSVLEKPSALVTESNSDPVIHQQGHLPTGSENDPVHYKPGEFLSQSTFDSVRSEPVQKKTEPNLNPVQRKPSSNETRLDDDRVKKKPSRHFKEYLRDGSLTPKSNFAAVPNGLLRMPELFDTPLDFMVYLHLFSYSFGFGKNTCDMGIAQLMKFTGSARNSVRSALERLQEQKWIKLLQDFECGGIARKWRIYTPFEKELCDEQTFFSSEESINKGSKSNPVKNKRGSNDEVIGSNLNPVTGVEFDPYKYNNKNNSKKTLSLDSEPIEKYLVSIQPEQKRESEKRHFQNLQNEIPTTEIEKAFLHLQQHGDLKSGERIHSPMSYLSVAIKDVLASAVEKERKHQAIRHRADQERIQNERRVLENEREESRIQEAFAAFKKQFPTEDEQKQYVQRYVREVQFAFPPNSKFALIAAVDHWFSNNTVSFN